MNVLEFIETIEKKVSSEDILMQLEDNKPTGGDEIDEKSSI